MKNLKRIIITLLALVLIIISTVFYSLKIAPSDIKIRKETLVSSQIDSGLDDFKIIFFSDVHYNAFVDYDRFNQVVEIINSQNPDIVLFGGDLFDHPANKIPTETQISEVTQLLSKIKAPFGKFAVLGNHDLEAVSSKEMISEILINSSFEIITNKNIRIRYDENSSFILAGLDSSLLGNPQFITTFDNIDSSEYTITICHTPDSVLEIQNNKVDLFLSGHSHGGQVYIPLIGSLYKNDYAKEFYRGKHDVNDTILDITNGVGTTKYDVRFMANPEIVVYTLQSKK